MQLELKIVNCRRGGSKALMAFDLALGVTTPEGKFKGCFLVTDFFLKSGRKGMYYNSPARPAVDSKTKQPILENGYAKMHEFFRLFAGPGPHVKYGKKIDITPEAWEYRRALLARIAKAYEAFQERTL